MKKDKKIKVMVNGMGKMAMNVMNHISKDGRFELLPYALVGPEIEVSTGESIWKKEIVLISPNVRDDAINAIKNKQDEFISIDFTLPSVANEMANFYCRNELPFIMGTTGGDRELLKKTVENSKIVAVIAPNMAKQIVGFQAMMEFAAERFPNLFKGYSLKIMESHQENKADTSGTAKAMVGYFNKLGIPFSIDQINMIRDPEVQEIEVEVPKEYLEGHGWHTYTLISPDKTVKFEFIHNVSGRDIYAKGTLDAIIFLNQMRKKLSGIVFDMIDVLQSHID